MLRNVQEVLADKEFKTGDFYHHRGSFPAAANRMSFVTQQYPLYSGSDEALWELADSYQHMGDRFENQRRRRPHETREGLSAEPTRPNREGTADGPETPHPGGGSRRLRAHEV